MRVDQVMNFAWKFMLPMAFTCIIAAAVWHYQARRLAGWLWSLGVLAAVYLALSRDSRDAERNLRRAPIASPNEQRRLSSSSRSSRSPRALAAATLPKLIHAALCFVARLRRRRRILLLARRGVRRPGPGFCLRRRGRGPDRLHDSAHPARRGEGSRFQLERRR